MIWGRWKPKGRQKRVGGSRFPIAFQKESEFRWKVDDGQPLRVGTSPAVQAE